MQTFNVFAKLQQFEKKIKSSQDTKSQGLVDRMKNLVVHADNNKLESEVESYNQRK